MTKLIKFLSLILKIKIVWSGIMLMVFILYTDLEEIQRQIRIRNKKENERKRNKK